MQRRILAFAAPTAALSELRRVARWRRLHADLGSSNSVSKGGEFEATRVPCFHSCVGGFSAASQLFGEDGISSQCRHIGWRRSGLRVTASAIPVPLSCVRHSLLPTQCSVKGATPKRSRDLNPKNKKRRVMARCKQVFSGSQIGPVPYSPKIMGGKSKEPRLTGISLSGCRQNPSEARWSRWHGPR